MKFKLLLIMAMPFCLVAHATDSNNFVIREINISGLQRIESSTVMSYLPIKVGDSMSPSASDDIINKLYATGFFNDIRIETKGQILMVGVQERPIIDSLVIVGDYKLDHDVIVKSLKENGLAGGLIYNQETLDSAILSLKSAYYNRGFYTVQITPNIVPLARNRVSIRVTITEGSVAKIATINFTGNKIFSSSNLRSQMYLTTGNLLSWWYKDNQYSSEQLNGDIANISAFYLNQGYLDFRINSIQVQLSPDKQKIFININLDEGSQYRYNTVKLAGNTKEVDPKSLEKLITAKPKQIINQEQLTRDIEAIKNALASHGYAAAVVNPIKDVDKTNKKVSYTLFIDPGKKIYVRNINISGNNQTRDAVIRRELRQQEASVYNSDAIKLSKNRLDVLGYFKSTAISTTPSLETNDQVDLDVKVEETETGKVQFGLGYAPASGIMGDIAWVKNNLFGSGKAVSLNANASNLSQGLSFSFTDPYFLSNGTSLGYDLAASQSTPNKAGISDYSLINYRAGVRSSVPVSDYDRINFQLAVENYQININNNNAPAKFIQFVNQYGTSVSEIPFTVSWLRNTIDSYQWPTTGAKYKQLFTISVPAIGPQYYKFHSTNDWYFPISKSFTWKTTGIVGFINSYGNNNTAPFYQNFFVGGPDSLRGFFPGSLGPKDPVDNSSLGATRWIFLSNNFLFPIPGFKNERIARMSLFYDLGSAFGGGSTTLTTEQTIRGSAGIAVNWFSPIGPLTISYAYPMFTQPGDNLQNIQFTFGTNF